LLVSRKATDFCKMFLYHATLLMLFMVSRDFFVCVELFGSFRCKIMLSVNRDSLTSSFPIYMKKGFLDLLSESFFVHGAPTGETIFTM
jgi:hypothetical protein